MGEDLYQAILKNEIPGIRTELVSQYNIQKNEIISFLYGHAVLENFFKPLLNKIIKLLHDKAIEKLNQQLSGATEKVKQNRISKLINLFSEQDLKTKLNDGFKSMIYAGENKQIKVIQQKMVSELDNVYLSERVSE